VRVKRIHLLESSVLLRTISAQTQDPTHTHTHSPERKFHKVYGCTWYFLLFNFFFFRCIIFPCCRILENSCIFCLFVCLFRTAPVADGSSQARGRIGAAAASVCHSLSNAGSEPCLRPTPQPQQCGSLTHWARPGILMDTRQVSYHWATMGTPRIDVFFLDLWCSRAKFCSRYHPTEFL